MIYLLFIGIILKIIIPVKSEGEEQNNSIRSEPGLPCLRTPNLSQYVSSSSLARDGRVLFELRHGIHLGNHSTPIDHF